VSDLLVALVGVLAGAIAALSGFGIGSLLTPVFALSLDTKLAVAAVSIPHLVGTALRFSRMRRHVARDVFLRFGVPSAIGGLAGAFLHNILGSPALEAVFGALLLFAGASELSGLSRRLRFEESCLRWQAQRPVCSAVWWATRAAFAALRSCAMVSRARRSWRRQRQLHCSSMACVCRFTPSVKSRDW
jgi:uncharacterized membrane protein YfcA